MFFAPQFSVLELACHVFVFAAFCIAVTTGFLYCFPQVLQKRFVTPKVVKKSAAKAAEDAKDKTDLAQLARNVQELKSSVLAGAGAEGGRR